MIDIVLWVEYALCIKVYQPFCGSLQTSFMQVLIWLWRSGQGRKQSAKFIEEMENNELVHFIVNAPLCLFDCSWPDLAIHGISFLRFGVPQTYMTYASYIVSIFFERNVNPLSAISQLFISNMLSNYLYQKLLFWLSK